MCSKLLMLCTKTSVFKNVYCMLGPFLLFLLFSFPCSAVAPHTLRLCVRDVPRGFRERLFQKSAEHAPRHCLFNQIPHWGSGSGLELLTWTHLGMSLVVKLSATPHMDDPESLPSGAGDRRVPLCPCGQERPSFQGVALTLFAAPDTCRRSAHSSGSRPPEPRGLPRPVKQPPRRVATAPGLSALVWNSL